MFKMEDLNFFWVHVRFSAKLCKCAEALSFCIWFYFLTLYRVVSTELFRF